MSQAIVVLSLLSAVLASLPPHANIAGEWRLVPEQSDDARVKLADAMARGPLGRRGGYGRGFPADWRGGRPGVAPRAGGGDDADSMRSVLLFEFLEPALRMTIVQTDEEITLQDANENTIVLRPDGKKWRRAGGAVRTRTRWHGMELVAESSTGRSRLKTTYRLIPPAHLEVRYRFQPPFGPDVAARRIYELASATAHGDSP